MPVQMGARGRPGFDEPIALMIDCHRRIEGFLAVLERVALRCAEGPLNLDAARAQRLLHPQTLERIGREMAARRGLAPIVPVRPSSSHLNPSASP